MTEILIEPTEGLGRLRGINRAAIKFEYPISVLVGRNGSGKTTVLHLAALAYGKQDGSERSDYRFNDFFSLAYREPAYTGFKITWRFSGADVEDLVTVRRSTKKWMHYERRPRRDVRFVGLSRISAPSESLVHRRAFSSEPDTRLELDGLSKDYLSRILKTKYGAAETQHRGKYELASLRTDAEYSGFNMGTGEGALVTILSELQTISDGGLLLVEEVELGLHPSASRELAKVLVEAAKKKSLQIICTSHSEWFIDALPREARVLLTKHSGGEVHSYTGATTRTAIAGISDSNLPELTIVCEDAFAEELIKLKLSAALRRKVQVLTMGSKNQLCRAAKTLSQATPQIPMLIVWDSETTNKEIADSIRSAKFEESLGFLRTEWFRLPGGFNSDGSEVTSNGKSLPPECAIKETLIRNDTALEMAAKTMRMSIEELRQALNSAILTEGSHHNLFYELSNTVALDTQKISSALIEGYLAVAPLQALVDQVERMLNGEFLAFEPPS